MGRCLKSAMPAQVGAGGRSESRAAALWESSQNPVRRGVSQQPADAPSVSLLSRVTRPRSIAPGAGAAVAPRHAFPAQCSASSDSKSNGRVTIASEPSAARGHCRGGRSRLARARGHDHCAARSSVMRRVHDRFTSRAVALRMRVGREIWSPAAQGGGRPSFEVLPFVAANLEAFPRLPQPAREIPSHSRRASVTGIACDVPRTSEIVWISLSPRLHP